MWIFNVDFVSDYIFHSFDAYRKIFNKFLHTSILHEHMFIIVIENLRVRYTNIGAKLRGDIIAEAREWNISRIEQKFL